MKRGMQQVFLVVLTILRLERVYARNRLYVFIPFSFILMIVAVFLLFSNVAAPVMPFVYSLF